MKVLIVADVLGIPNNGTTIACYNLIESLKKRGHEVRVLCADKDKKDWANYFVADTLNLWPFNGYVARNGISLAKADRQLIEKALDGVDVVHCMMPFSLANKTAKIASEKNIAITAGFHVQAENVTSHFYMMHSKAANQSCYKVFWQKLYKNVDCIHYPTKFIKGDFEEVIGPTNGYVISNGINKFWDKERTAKPEEFAQKFVILSTGRYAREKMQKILIKSMKYSKYADKIQLILAGEGPHEKKLRKYAKSLVNEPMYGLHDKEELRKIINYSDLYVHCAHAELESIACLEAIKCGLVPVINKSNRAAPRFFALDERNLYKKNDPKSLAQKIDYWIEHPEEKEAQSTAYLNFTKKFEFEHCMDRMEQMMKDAIQIHKFKVENNLKKRVILYDDPINEDFAGTQIEQIKLPDNFKYVNKNIFFRLCATLIYRVVAQPLIWIWCKLKRGIRVHNRKVLKKVHNKGYFLSGNHTSLFDAVFPQALVSKAKRTYIIANPDVVSIKGIKNLVMMLGTLPTPSSAATVKSFNEAIEYRIKHKSVVAIYPEAHIWPFYNGLREYGDVSFQYPAKLNAPVIAMATTWRKGRGKHRPYMDITLSDPIYPNPDLSLKENQKYLRDQVYDFQKRVIDAAEKQDCITYIKAFENSSKYDK